MSLELNSPSPTYIASMDQLGGVDDLVQSFVGLPDPVCWYLLPYLYRNFPGCRRTCLLGDQMLHGYKDLVLATHPLFRRPTYHTENWLSRPFPLRIALSIHAIDVDLTDTIRYIGFGAVQTFISTCRPLSVRQKVKKYAAGHSSTHPCIHACRASGKSPIGHGSSRHG